MFTAKIKMALCLSLLVSCLTLSLKAADSGDANTTNDRKYTDKQLICAGAAGLAVGAVGALLYYHSSETPTPSNFPFFTELPAKSIVIWGGITFPADLIRSGRINVETTIKDLTEAGYAIFVEKGIHIK